MLKNIFSISTAFLFVIISNSYSQQVDPMTVSLARQLGKELFEGNGVPYLQPVVEAINTTSNSRFFNGAFVPKKVDKPYFRISVNGMFGFVPESKKSYVPTIPSEEFNWNGAMRYAKPNININDPSKSTITINDTAGLLAYAMKGMLYNGLKNGSLIAPNTAPTALGKGNVILNLPPDTLLKLLHNLSIEDPVVHQKWIIYNYLPDSLKAKMDKIIGQFPYYFTLPPGNNMNSIFASIPQLEIGSLFGTEALIRFIPPVNMGSNIGKFAFWGIGLKHSISQYFNKTDRIEDRTFDMSIQAVYQGTRLTNSVGVTNAEMTADASFWDFNLQFSKSFYDFLPLIPGIVDIYSGFSYEMVTIKSQYKYYLPVEVQWQLGLMKLDSASNQIVKDPPLYPGDQEPQTANLQLKDNNFKAIFGINKHIGNFSIFFDYNFSKFSIFTGGIAYQF